MGAPRLLASLAASAHAVIRLVQILRLAPFHLGPVTQGGAAPPRPPPDIWSALLLLLRAGCRCCRAAVAAAAAPGGLLLGSRGPLGRVLHPQGAHRKSGTRSAGGARAAAEGVSTSTGPTHTHKTSQGRRRDGGPTTLEGRTTPGGERRQARPAPHEHKRSYPFLGHRSLRFPGVGAAGATRPRDPRTWIKERATAVRHTTMSSHRSMHTPGRTRGGGNWWKAGR